MGRWALTATVINSVIGSGVYGLPGTLVQTTGYWSPLAVLAGGACILIIVVCFAEVGGRFDDAGGPYLYVRESLGPAAGFHIGWLHVWTRIFSAAAVLNVLVAYLATLIPWTGVGSGRLLTMTATMVLVTAVNVSGIRQTAWTVNAFTIAKLLPLVAVSLLGLFWIDRGVVASQAVPDPRWTDAVLLLLFAYGGFESSVIAGSETRNPKRDTPFALLAAMLVITAIYSLVQLTVVGVLPNAAGNTTPIASVLGIMIGPAGAALTSAAVVVSVYGWLTGFALMTPRILYAMGDRGELPAWLGRVHPRARTPHIAIVLNSAVALALGLSAGFPQLAALSATSRIGILAATCVSLIVLRRKWGMPDGFRAPAGPWLAMAGTALCLWILSGRTWVQIWPLAVVVAAGAAAWMLTRRAHRTAAATSV
jgi:basic amino acid/polyamine antiporter, APA family